MRLSHHPAYGSSRIKYGTGCTGRFIQPTLRLANDSSYEPARKGLSPAGTFVLTLLTHAHTGHTHARIANAYAA
ncbi:MULTISPECIES: hypothetical protein [Reichenbachiella]|uniref:hypothetical protein n=1 Tax=Reichenbachiella TaxID=156993 RepID=UPI0011C469B3|nr:MULTISPECIES: hypothetical protein [Reichenbachiella]MBU2913446.1 hypothetical protein [Reichenbachiella agariperforans]